LSDDDIIRNLVPHLVVWVGVLILLVYVNSRRGRQTGFLVYAYLALFFLNHWFGAMVHALPWSPFEDYTNTAIGFRESTYGLIALAVGVLLTPTFRSRSHLGHGIQSAEDGPHHLLKARRVARYYLVIGVAAWILSFADVAKIPSLGAVISAGKQAAVLAICLNCWIAWHKGEQWKFVGWLVGSFAFPMVTMLGAGFLGYGVAIIITIFAFVGMFYRPKWRLVAASIPVVYLGLSLYVGYADSRGTIREAVWGGEEIGRRIDAALDMLARTEFFDVWDEAHLFWIDSRLNQNELVGAAVRYTPAAAPFLYGQTISDAAIAVIPRAIWPEKPVTAGSGEYVSDQTGIRFAEGTSVGMGQVLEFYINFGTTGVVVGFLLFGMALRFMDDRLGASLSRADWNAVAFWFVIGTSALQVGGALAEISASMMAGAVLTVASGFLLRERGGHRLRRDSGTAGGTRHAGGFLTRHESRPSSMD
jgi:hypothetical protein